MIFTGCVFSFDLGTSVKYKEKENLRKQIIENGGTFSYIVTKKVQNFPWTLYIMHHSLSMLRKMMLNNFKKCDF